MKTLNSPVQIIFFSMKSSSRNLALPCDKILIFVLSTLIHVVKTKTKTIFMIKRGKKAVSILLKVFRQDWIRDNHIKYNCRRHWRDLLHHEVALKLQSAFTKHELSLLWRKETKKICKWHQGNDRSVHCYGNLVPFIKYFPNVAVSLQ